MNKKYRLLCVLRTRKHDKQIIYDRKRSSCRSCVSRMFRAPQVALFRSSSRTSVNVSVTQGVALMLEVLNTDSFWDQQATIIKIYNYKVHVGMRTLRMKTHFEIKCIYKYPVLTKIRYIAYKKYIEVQINKIK